MSALGRNRTLDRRQHDNPRFLLAASTAPEALADGIEIARPATANHLNAAHGPGRAAVTAHNLKAAPEADEIGSGIDVLGGHSRRISA